MQAGHPHPDTRHRLFFAAITGVALLLALPIAVVLTAPVHTPAPEWAHVARHLLPAHLLGTLMLLAGVLLPALTIAVSTAWLVAVHDFPGRRFFHWALVLPLALPTYISAFAHAALLGPTGTLSAWSERTLGIRPDIMSLPGLCLVMALVLFPYIYLPARAAFARGMSSQLDAARTLGAGPWRCFAQVALPLARPAIAAGATLVAMETLNDYGAVKYFGERTLTTAIFRSWGGLYDLGSALRLGAVLLALVALLLWLEQRSRASAPPTTDQVATTRSPLRGAPAWLAAGWCTAVLLLAAGLPLFKIVRDVWHIGTPAHSIGLLTASANTLRVAALASITTLVIAVLFVFLGRHRRSDPWVVRLANLGYAIPGAVIAVGVMVVAGLLDRSRLLPVALIGSVGLLTYAFAVRFLAVGHQPLRGALQQQSPSLDEAARLLGASRWRTFVTINLPLLRHALLAAALLVSIDVIKELPLTLILRPFDLHTLSTLSYELANIEQLREASLPALCIVVCGLLPVLVLDRLAGRNG